MTEKAKALYALQDYELRQVSGHEGGRNLVYVCSLNGENRYVLRISALGDRTEEDYLAETEFVHYLAVNGAPVADVIPSARGRLVECIEEDDRKTYISLFAYAKGMLMWENGYRYREGAPLEEYFRNTGRALGAIHRLSRQYRPVHRRPAFSDKYNTVYIDRLIPDSRGELKKAIVRRLEEYKALPTDPESYGLVHFDFSDGNYHVDMNTGEITAFDFDNCIYCWYMFDLAHLWTHGVGWYRHEADPAKRKECMDRYFETILEGYRSETDVPEDLLKQLPLFIDMTIIEYIIDAFECSAREGEEPDEEDIGFEAECLIRDIPYAGFFSTDPQPGRAYEPLVRRFAERSAEILGEQLTGIYLHGSAAMGCFQPEKSDLDFLVVVREELTDAKKREYMDMVLELDAEGPAKGIEMSIVTGDACNPFVYPTPFLLHYSRMHTAWYRRDPEDYVRKMKGTDRDLAAHFTVTRNRGICLYGPPAAEVFGEVPEADYLDSIWNDVSGAEEEITDNPMYLILNLARVLAYRREKAVLSKLEGGEWGIRNLPEEYRPLVRTALREYRDGEEVRYDPAAAKHYAAYMLEQIRKPSVPERETEGG